MATIKGRSSVHTKKRISMQCNEKNVQGRTENLVEYLRWSFLRKQLTAFDCVLTTPPMLSNENVDLHIRQENYFRLLKIQFFY